MITLNIRQILRFFDENIEVTKHSNAIKIIIGEELMLALLLEYFKRTEIYSYAIVEQPCTTGKKKGPWLDAWLKVQDSMSSNPFFYQVEVKSWSAHGIGGKSKFIDPDWSESEFSEYKRKIWGHYWNNGKFSADAVNKVLTPMKPPELSATVKPLACLWEMMHPEGNETPFFTVKTAPNSYFSEVSVFSISSFLRGLHPKEPVLTLELPILSERLDQVNKLFTTK
jgi:hypothetical protein